MSIESIVTGHFDIVLLGTLVTTFWILPGGPTRHADESTPRDDETVRRLIGVDGESPP
ncbi:MAG: hypothetical protein M3N47_05330 [Chloroflexota bacterium]|nr:hypothetical protein [Chloroflexota bacterium]